MALSWFHVSLSHASADTVATSKWYGERLQDEAMVWFPTALVAVKLVLVFAL